MVRRQADASFVALSRRRADLVSAHFGLVCAAANASPAGGGAQLGFSVPKRLLPHAVDRNSLKRVAREAWRLAAWNGRARPPVALIRLHRLDVHWTTMPDSTRKKAWRAELDVLLARFLRGSGERVPVKRSPEPGR